MNSIKVKVSAKINLSLDVLGKRADGYHNIESVFQSIGIYDTLTVTKLEKQEILISCSDPDVPCNERNIAYKAAELFFESTGITGGVSIHIEKEIPSQAGLGGGSSDGAGVIYALNLLYNVGLSSKKLTALGGKISADTAFFTVGGTAYASGIGDVIEPLRYISNIDIVVAKGGCGVSTPVAYKLIDDLVKPSHPKTEKLLKALDKGKFMSECSLCKNIFEEVTDIDDIKDIKKSMLEMGALNSLMSGSGSAVFGIFADKESALQCAEKLSEKYSFAQYCRTTSDSIVVI